MVDVLLAQAVLVAVLQKTLAGINHEDATAGAGVVLVQHQDAGGNTGAVEQVGGQADDAGQHTAGHQLPADSGLGIATEQHAVRQNAGALAAGFQAAQDVQQVGVIALLGRWHAPGKPLEGIGIRGEAAAPSLVRKWRIGDHVVEGAQRVAILELGVGQGVARLHRGIREVVQDHVHAGKAGGGGRDFLPVQGDLVDGFGGHLQQQRA